MNFIKLSSKQREFAFSFFSTCFYLILLFWQWKLMASLLLFCIFFLCTQVNLPLQSLMYTILISVWVKLCLQRNIPMLTHCLWRKVSFLPFFFFVCLVFRNPYERLKRKWQNSESKTETRTRISKNLKSNFCTILQLINDYYSLKSQGE